MLPGIVCLQSHYTPVPTTCTLHERAVGCFSCDQYLDRAFKNYSLLVDWRGGGDGERRACERKAQSFCLDTYTPVKMTFSLAYKDTVRQPDNVIVNIHSFSLAS